MNYALWFQLASPEIVLSIAGLLLLLIAAWSSDKSARLVSILTVAAFFGALALSLNFLLADGYAEGADAFYGQYRMDRFAALSKVLIFLSAIACVIVAPKFFARDGMMRAEYPILILFASVGMGLMVSAVDLLTLYIGLELQSLAAYVLASFLRSDDRSAEAGLKYFVLGALASGILLFGMSLLYGFTGTTSFIGIQTAFSDGVSTGALFGVVFVLSGLAFKISAVPFHMWTPDVYEGAPTPVTTFFATAPKVAALALTMRVAIEAFGGQQSVWQQIVIFVAMASILLGGVAAIGQTNIKRLLAYSSINNVGFMLIGLACGTPEGASAMMTYLIIYVAMTLGSFICVLDLNDREGRPVEDIPKLAGLSRTRPGLAAALAVFMFSLAGIPPLFGFWGKFVVFDAAVAAGLIPLAALGIAASVIGAFYYLKVIKVMYFDEPADVIAPSDSTARLALIAVSALFVSPLGYFATLALSPITEDAARALFWAA
ncbi:NADH-quinone oxidoreductase subunit NuoN [Blastomonas aquatica]|uniref:NADH-quinone oxidoreductase subunit N n=1 Tax=Blastomonas aquatica TaxID=1510276 RepID=A0ABQ1JI17_9SPHN|nr:NADH-quinone oxidoreductase subunit NuoN [Blastomonas aquatica]GGB66829.1 NADH-quinone oxidoreductase subunit N [Blastomonas aquatica]